MNLELQTFLDEVDCAGNFAGDLLPNGESHFNHDVLKAIAKLLGGNMPVYEILTAVYTELHRIERGAV